MIENKTARLIITFKCPRKCEYCCNQYKSIMENAIEIDDLSQIVEYDSVCITGGEPSLDIMGTLGIIHKLRRNNPEQKIYMYSAWYRVHWGPALIPELDGVHYTLHKGATRQDIKDFHHFQARISFYPDKSYRLYIHNSIDDRITIFPNLWSRLEIKPWVAEEDCELPNTEDLFILREK